jgi:predicted nucleic acid-binding protein
MIVGDTNLIVYLYVDSDFTSRARQVHAIDPDWVFPPVARSEAANVLATLTREKWISPETAIVALERIEPRIVAGLRDVPMRAALELAVQRGVSVYDAQFIVLAGQLGVSLVTEDNRLKRGFPGVAISMEAFIDRAGGRMVREPRAAYGGRRKR